jgi:hypothetical protein
MFIKKVLETYIDITNPNDIFSADVEKMLISKLNDKFVGKCYMSCLITKVNSIIKRSFIYMKDTLLGDGSINIMFEVDAIEYIKNEIITGCKIIKKESNGIIHAISEYAGIQINIPSSLSIFKEGDYIPVIVKMVRYNINQSTISILATPFVPNSDPIIYYKIIDHLSTPELNVIKSLLNQINDEELFLKNINANSKKIYNFFDDLLSKKTQKINYKKLLPGNITNVKISDILNIKSGIVFNNKLEYSNLYIINSADTNITNTEILENVVEESMFIAFTSLLTNHLVNLQSMRGFIKHYPTIESIKKSKDIWSLYTVMKIKQI